MRRVQPEEDFNIDNFIYSKEDIKMEKRDALFIRSLTEIDTLRFTLTRLYKNKFISGESSLDIVKNLQKIISTLEKEKGTK
jgi:hypothetical protein